MTGRHTIIKERSDALEDPRFEGTLHGYSVVRRIEQISGDLLPRVRFYRLARAGHKLVEAERRDWEQTRDHRALLFETQAEACATRK